MELTEPLGLHVPYLRAALPLISMFGRESAILCGASMEEAGQIELAVEEAALFIIDTIPKDLARTETFSIFCQREAEGVRFRLRNQGLPVDLEGLPSYTSEAPEEHLEGLGLHLIRSVMDEVQFRNHGCQGWETILVKRLGGLAELVPAREDAVPANSSGHQETISYSVSRLTPEMAYDLSKLTYHTYGYSYPRESFYYPDRLAEMIRSSEVVSFVACLDTGEIIGHLGLHIEPECPQMADVMLGMVAPSYRRSHCLMRIAQATVAHAVENNIVCLFSELVTKHVYSQKSAAMFGLRPASLQVSHHPRPDFRAMGGASKDREALLDAFIFFKPPGDVPIAAPERHADIIARILSGLNVTWQPIAAVPAVVNTEATRLCVTKQAEIGLATIRVEHYGQDFLQEVTRARRQLCREHVDTIYLFLDLSHPYTASVSPEIEAAGFFFSGIRPKTPERWELLCTYLNNQSIDYETIQIFDPFGVELLEYVKGCEQRAQEAV